MSIRNFLCPDGGKIPCDDCLQEGGCRMGERCATRPYLMLCSKERDHGFRCTSCKAERRMPPTNKKFAYPCLACGSPMEYIPSTTQCISGTKYAFLKLTNDYDVSPDSRAFMIQGTSTHFNLEQPDDECSLIEEKFSESEISGILDIVTTENNYRILSDNKNTGSFKVAKALGFYVDEEKTGEFYKSGKRKGEEKTRKIVKRDDTKRDVEDWAWQLNKYRIDYEKKFGHKIDKLKVQAIVRDGNTHIARSRGVFRNVYYFEIPILPDIIVNEYFNTKRNNLLKALKQGYWNEVCTAHECWDGIKCANYCEVADNCTQGKYLKTERMKEGEMPIQGLSEARRLPRMGKIRLGIMKKSEKSGKEYPAEVNYFILDPAVENDIENKRLIDIFKQKYGEKPTSIPIMFPVADVEKVFPQYYKSYGSSTMLNCKGDGIEATTNNPEYQKRLPVVRDGEMGKVVKCAGQNCPYYKEGKCTESATLSVLLPELPGAGVWQITTGSFNSILNLNSCFDYIRAIAGRFHMIPLRLERRETPIQHEGKKTNHYILHINMEIALAELQKLAKIDPDRITMELPAIDDDKADLYLENNAVVNPPAAEAQPVKVEPPKAEPVKAVEDAVIVEKPAEPEPAEYVEGVIEQVTEWKVKHNGQADVPLFGALVKGVLCITFDASMLPDLKKHMESKTNVWLIYQKKVNPSNNKPYNELVDIKNMQSNDVPY